MSLRNIMGKNVPWRVHFRVPSRVEGVGGGNLVLCNQIEVLCAPPVAPTLFPIDRVGTLRDETSSIVICSIVTQASEGKKR